MKVFCLFGLFVILYSFIEAMIYLSLFDDRNTHCPPTFRKQEIIADVFSVFHHIYLMTFGLSVLLYGILPASSLLVTFSRIVFCLSVLDIGFILLITKRLGFDNLKGRIKLKWSKEKKFDRETHDAEVNMYRAIERLDKYKVQSFVSALFVAILFFVTFI